MKRRFSFKALLKSVAMHPAMRLYRVNLFRFRLRRDWSAVVKISEKLESQPLRLERRLVFPEGKSTRTLFILGSGASVNRLSRIQFQEIQRHCSVGINVWAAHRFVPDCYSFESGGFPRTDDEFEHRAYLSRCLTRPEVIESRPSFVVLRPASPSSRDQLIEIPESLADREFFYGRANLPQSNTKVIKDDLRALTASFLSQKTSIGALPDNGASVIRMIFLGLKLNFSKIVLLGVDLSDSPYFWYEKPYVDSRPEMVTLFPRPLAAPHDTLDDSKRPFNTRNLIVELAKVFRSEHQCEILSGLSHSGWDTDLATFDWGRDLHSA